MARSAHPLTGHLPGIIRALSQVDIVRILAAPTPVCQRRCGEREPADAWADFVGWRINYEQAACAVAAAVDVV